MDYLLKFFILSVLNVGSNIECIYRSLTNSNTMCIYFSKAFKRFVNPPATSIDLSGAALHDLLSKSMSELLETA